MSMMGKFHTLGMEIGLIFNFGKTKWNNKVHRTHGVLPITSIGEYNNLKEKEPVREMQTTMVVVDKEVPSGMVTINRGHLKMGLTKQDSIWGIHSPVRGISVDDFKMDVTEVTNRMYKAFIQDIIDSIIAQRMEDPYYEGDIEKVRESLYITNPVTGESKLDGRQLIYVYEEYDYTAANKRKFRLDPRERILDTDKEIPDEEILISKDTKGLIEFEDKIILCLKQDEKRNIGYAKALKLFDELNMIVDISEDYNYESLKKNKEFIKK